MLARLRSTRRCFSTAANAVKCALFAYYHHNWAGIAEVPCVTAVGEEKVRARPQACARTGWRHSRTWCTTYWPGRERSRRRRPPRGTPCAPGWPRASCPGSQRRGCSQPLQPFPALGGAARPQPPCAAVCRRTAAAHSRSTSSRSWPSWACSAPTWATTAVRA